MCGSCDWYLWHHPVVDDNTTPWASSHHYSCCIRAMTMLWWNDLQYWLVCVCKNQTKVGQIEKCLVCMCTVNENLCPRLCSGDCSVGALCLLYICICYGHTISASWGNSYGTFKSVKQDKVFCVGDCSIAKWIS